MQPSIIIIGSGIAGLAADNYLAKHGVSAKILEARDRVGGRICLDNSLGVTLGRGASWLHGTEGNPLSDLLSKRDESFFTFDSKLFYFYNKSGNKIADADINQFNELFDSELNISKKHAFACEHDLSLFSSLSKSFDLTKKLTTDEEDLFFEKLKFFENYIGANYENLSARYWDAEESIPGPHGVLSDAYGHVIKALSENCDIYFNTIVQSITRTNIGVIVNTTTGSYVADKVIVTVPLGILKQNDIVFQPDLPTTKMRAIQQLGMGLFNIIALRFSYCFWDSTCHAFSLPEKDIFSTFFNIGKFLNTPILLGYVGGDTGRRLEMRSDQNIVEDLMKIFRKYFDRSCPEPESFFVTRWSSDPFSRGSYSYYGVGSSYDDRDYLAEPIDSQIYFAGEATHREFPATTHGAYLSGIREAKRILSDLKVNQ